jgi:DNA-binding NarL/FixJ family response regulator
MVRQGLGQLLQSTVDIEVVGFASEGREAIRFCAENLPDVVLMDIMMPGMDGLAATRFIRRLQPNVKVVLFSIYCDGETMQAARDAGAHTLLSKSVSSDEILDIVRAICKDN